MLPLRLFVRNKSLVFHSARSCSPQSPSIEESTNKSKFKFEIHYLLLKKMWLDENLIALVWPKEYVLADFDLQDQLETKTKQEKV